MFDHIGLVVRDAQRSVTFYRQCLAPLGLRVLETYESAAIFGTDAQTQFLWVGTMRPSFWADEHSAGQSPMHLAFTAPSREAVDAFHVAALSAGGVDHGAPGIRSAGGFEYYAAFVLDPDGNNIEAGHRSK